MKLLLLILLLIGLPAYAEPIAVARVQDLVITLYSEKCAIGFITNLPQRATWAENGKTYEGCFGLFGNESFGAYFDDGTVVVIPTTAFRRVQAL